LKIRQEQPSDYGKVYELAKISFATSPHCDGDEQDYLNDIRKGDSFIPELSLVAENNWGTIVGQVILHKADITDGHKSHTQLVLGPICTHPDHFRRGIARAMVDEALDIAAQLGYRAVFLCGDPEIYSRLGFAPTYRYGIHHKKDATAEWSMVRELYDGALDGITGIINTI